MQLKYTGPSTAETGVVPLPEGWPATDHEELDPAIAAAKLAFRVYRTGDTKGRPTGAYAYIEARPLAQVAASAGDTPAPADTPSQPRRRTHAAAPTPVPAPETPAAAEEA